jgi:hypothetical protein
MADKARYVHPLGWFGSIFIEFDLSPSRRAPRQRKPRDDPNTPVTSERHVWPPLRSWAAQRVLARHRAAPTDVLARARELPPRDGAAVVTGTVHSAAELDPEQARTVIDIALRRSASCVSPASTRSRRRSRPNTFNVSRHGSEGEVERLGTALSFSSAPEFRRDSPAPRVLPAAASRCSPEFRRTIIPCAVGELFRCSRCRTGSGQEQRRVTCFHPRVPALGHTGRTSGLRLPAVTASRTGVRTALSPSAVQGAYRSAPRTSG